MLHIILERGALPSGPIKCLSVSRDKRIERLPLISRCGRGGPRFAPTPTAALMSLASPPAAIMERGESRLLRLHDRVRVKGWSEWGACRLGEACVSWRAINEERDREQTDANPGPDFGAGPCGGSLRQRREADSAARGREQEAKHMRRRAKRKTTIALNWRRRASRAGYCDFARPRGGRTVKCCISNEHPGRPVAYWGASLERARAHTPVARMCGNIFCPLSAGAKRARALQIVQT